MPIVMPDRPKLPPPAPHPIPVPAPDEPPPVDIELTEFEDMPTHVERRCLGCAGPVELLDDDVQPPDSYAEAYKPPVRCRATRDISRWFFCPQPVFDEVGALKVPGAEGYLELPGRMAVQFYPERRLVRAWVPVDRRSMS
jgi:hypothetical protein